MWREVLQDVVVLPVGEEVEMEMEEESIQEFRPEEGGVGGGGGGGGSCGYGCGRKKRFALEKLIAKYQI